MLRILGVGEEEDKRARGDAGAAEDGDQIGRRRGGRRRLREECLREGVEVGAREEGGAPDKRAEVAVQAVGGGAQRQDGVGEGEQRGARRERGEVERSAGGGGGGQRSSGRRREHGRDREEEAPVLREVHGGQGRGERGPPAQAREGIGGAAGAGAGRVERGGGRHALEREVEQGAGLVGGKVFG
jgi:hypothetical protein